MAGLPWLYVIAWVLSVGIIIWWYERKVKKMQIEIANSTHRSEYLEDELAFCRQKVMNDNLDPLVINPQKAPLPFLNDTTADEKDDLKIVEGIGPKIEKLLQEAGIFTFDQLANSTPDAIKEILDAAGSRYSLHNPTTWPKQAELARDGKWGELKKWQSELNKGRII